MPAPTGDGPRRLKNHQTLEQVFEGFARDLYLGDLFLASGVGAKRDLRVAHFLSDRLDFACDSRDFFANGCVAHLVTCWHPHLKGLVRQENSIYNDWRMEHFWLDK